MNKYYNEGDDCPKCKNGMLIAQQEQDTGWVDIKCQDCGYIATDDEKQLKE